MNRIVVVIVAVFLGSASWLILTSQRDQQSRRRDTEASGAPLFEVRVITPVSNRPLAGLFGFFTGEQQFDSQSPGATAAVGHSGRLEFAARGWALSIAFDPDARIGRDTTLESDFLLDERPRLRCRPDSPPVGEIEWRAVPGETQAHGTFYLELATCENAQTGNVIEWPNAPLTVTGRFDGVPRRSL